MEKDGELRGGFAMPTPYNYVSWKPPEQMCKPFTLRMLHQLANIAFDVRTVLHFVRSVQSNGMMGNGIITTIVFTLSVIALFAASGIMSAKQPVVMLRAIHIAASATSYLTT